MEPLFTPEQLAEIHAYHQPYYIRAAVEPFVRLALLLLLLGVLVQPFYRLATAAAAGLERRLGFLRTAPVSRAFFSAMDRLWGEPGWGAAVIFALFTDLFVTLVYLPVDVWFSYTLEHRHGMSTQTPGTFAWDLLKGRLIAAFAIAALVIGLFGLARRLRHWWLVLGVPVALMLLVSSALDPYRGRIYFDQKPLAEGPVRERITGLMKQADIAFADVMVEETSVASRRLQAYFAGQGPTRTIVLNDVILKELSEDEVLAAVAHEAGHVQEPKWPARIASSLALVALLFALDRLLRLSASRGWFGTHRFADIRSLPLLSLLFFFVMVTARPISGAFSREREREADRYALRLTGDVDAFRRMLVKAARVNKMNPEPPRWVVLKGMSHPPIGERLASLPPP
ncbi:Zn-dependent protease with chaperone function [Myxococcus hansupus]|uniref:Zn-dependent protease with chaperone function n=1 Tax=Pseudomyxococcus hansupus TaxID=1297742 RepID=A0A0H4WN32_9BACT|nr:M48 family metalloprotease [Myxococcus hansupus]AKQ64179.1 Zn-dependent protease with chaperone function [Myxococcus hansupus]